jgi:acetate kinase
MMHAEPERITPALLAELRRITRYDPDHLPREIALIQVLQQRHPQLPQVACFDTAFHRHMPELAQRLPLPDALWDVGVRRYGFHGLSYEYIVGALGAAQLGRAVVAHLGNGASMVAVDGGQSVDTTMGFTPAGGLVMSTRSGDLDPGIPVYLAREQGYDPDRLEQLVDREAGLVALSGDTSDMQTLLERREHDGRAALAVDAFCYQARKHVGALATVLGGLDTLVFTGGIGEKAAAVRAGICDGLEHLGVELDAAANAADAAVISAPGAGCVVRVEQTDEDRVIARQTGALLAG